MSLVKKTDSNLPSIFDDIFKTDWLGGTLQINPTRSSIPAVNVQETEDTFLLEVVAPGKTKEDFTLELNNDVLIISSELKKESDTLEKKNFTRREFSYATFKRSFKLPETVNNSKINASYNKGILLVVLPKKEEAKVQPKRLIEIS